MRNREKEKIINIIFIAYILIRFIMQIFSQLENFTSNIIVNILIFAIALISVIIENLYIIVIFIVIKIMRKREYKKQLSKIDYKNEGEYYRDILNGYSPFLLSYIDNFIFEGKRDIIAAILNLQLKKVIKIENNKIIKLNEEINLEESEKYILNAVSNGKIKLANIMELENKIKKDAYNKDLIQIKETSNNSQILKRKFVKAFAINVIIFIILSITMSMINNENIVILFSFMAIIFCNPIFYVILYLIQYYLSKPKIRRTKKGEEINIKLEGLKNYIQEYSKLKEKSTNDILLWEEYLVYSVIFNINDNIIKEMDELFD